MESTVLGSSTTPPPAKFKPAPLPRVPSSPQAHGMSSSPSTIPNASPTTLSSALTTAIPQAGQSSPRNVPGPSETTGQDGSVTPGSAPAPMQQVPSRIFLPPSANPQTPAAPGTIPAQSQPPTPNSATPGQPNTPGQTKPSPSAPGTPLTGTAQVNALLTAHPLSGAPGAGIGLSAPTPGMMGQSTPRQPQYTHPTPTFVPTNVDEEIWHRLTSKHPAVVHSTELALVGLKHLSKFTAVERSLDIIGALLSTLLECHSTITNVKEVKDALDMLANEASNAEREMASCTNSNWKRRQSFELLKMCSSQLTSLPLTSVKPFIPQLLHWQTLLSSYVRGLPRTCNLEAESPMLTEIEESNVVLLLPHQLIPAYPHIATAHVPYPNSHIDHNLYFPGTWQQVKWLRVSANVTVGRRFGSTGRGIHILCADGRTRSLWIRHRPQMALLSNQRMAKIARLIHWQLQRHITAQAMDLSVRIPSPMCVALGTEVTWYEGSEPVSPDTVQVGPIEGRGVDFSMDDVIDDFMGETGLGSNEGMALFWHQIEQLFEDGVTDQSDARVSQRKLQLYSDISHHVIPNDLLSRFIQQRLKLLDHVWGLRRRFTLRYACLSLLCHIFGIKSHTPAELQLSLRSGYVYLANAVMHIRSDPVSVEHPIVPLPLFHNFVTFMRPFSFGGPFVNSIAVMAEGIVSPADHMESILHAVLRSELLDREVHARKLRGESEATSSGPTTIQLGEAAQRITNSIVKDIRQFIVDDALDNDDPMKGGIKPVNVHLLSLLEASLSPVERLKLGVAHQPWF